MLHRAAALHRRDAERGVSRRRDLHGPADLAGLLPGQLADDLAEKVCSRIRDPKIEADCIFDVTVMGDVVAAKGHVQADRLRAALATPAWWRFAEPAQGRCRACAKFLIGRPNGSHDNECWCAVCGRSRRQFQDPAEVE